MKQRYKKIIAVLLALVILVLPIEISAVPIKGGDNYEKAYNASYDLYQIIAALLDEYVGSDITAEQLYNAAVRGIGEELDEYSYALDEKDFKDFIDSVNGDYEGIGIIMLNGDLTLINDVVENSPAAKAGVKPGDLIIKVNGSDVTKKNTTDISTMIRSSAVKSVSLEVKRGDKTLKFTMNKAIVHIKSVQVKKIEDLLPDVGADAAAGIRYVSISSFGDETAAEFESALSDLKKAGVKRIILDLRDNGGGVVEAAEGIANLILPEGPIYSYLGAGGEKETQYSTLKNPPLEHIAILTNYYTASASELLTSALQDAKIATVVGQKSYGKGSVQVLMETMTGGGFKFTVAEFLRRNGGKVNKVGVTPDIIINTPRYIEGWADNKAQAPDVIKDVRDVLTYLDYRLDKSYTYNDSVIIQIKKFQEENKLEQTGIPDEDTVYALNAALRAKRGEKDYELEAAYKSLKGR